MFRDKNAYERFERVGSVLCRRFTDRYGVMTRSLVDEFGVFRSKPAGTVDQEGCVLHLGTLQFVLALAMKLLDWVKSSDVYVLIRSCVFHHYEFDLIHPFADGNGRVGCLWHTLLLSKRNLTFVWLPVESMIHARQPRYYAAINASNNDGESTVFIEFMLSTIKASLIDTINVSDGMSDGPTDKAMIRWKHIEKFLKTHEFIMNADVRSLCGMSAATANRILAGLVTDNNLKKCYEKGHWVYKLRQQI